MRRRVKQIVASAVVLSVVGYVTWPLDNVMWRWVSHVPEPLGGDLGIPMVVLIVTGIVGFGITIASSIRLSELAIGGVLAYVFWLGVLILVFSFDEPWLPFLSYGLVLIGALLGSVIGTVIERRSKVENRTLLS